MFVLCSVGEDDYCDEIIFEILGYSDKKEILEKHLDKIIDKNKLRVAEYQREKNEFQKNTKNFVIENYDEIIKKGIEKNYAVCKNIKDENHKQRLIDFLTLNPNFIISIINRPLDCNYPRYVEALDKHNFAIKEIKEMEKK